MAIQKEIWEQWIGENLFQDNEFMNLAFNADMFVDNLTVHLPTAGTPAGVTRNRTSLPATTVQRTDAISDYTINEYTIDPTVITNAEQVELSYDKIASVLFDTMGQLRDTVGNNMLYHWAPTVSTYITRTTGSSTACHTTSATGTRKRILAVDLMTAAKILTKAKAPGADRYCMLDPDMYEQLLLDLKFGEFRTSVKEADTEKGVIGDLYGFKIMQRSSVLTYDNTGTPVPKTISATTGLPTGAATDNAAALCWSASCVERAFGDIKFFEKIGDPLFYGDVYSGLVRAGGRKRRYDGVGVVAIVQTLLT
jgi:hypothetical protein